MKTWLRTVVWRTLGFALCLGTAAMASAQQGVYMLDHGIYSPPGAIGSRQAGRGGPLRCFFQPVEIKAPPGASISLVREGRFDEPTAAPRKAGLAIGHVYRLKITGIPYEEGREIFPTIELIDRLHPPKGQETRFAIPIEITLEDLMLALEGKFVTRVIYLEDPDNALPIAADRAGDTSIDVSPSEDPVKAADELGRPMAILRLGGRLPEDATGVDRSFLGRSPPWVNIAAKRAVAPTNGARDESLAERDEATTQRR